MCACGSGRTVVERDFQSNPVYASNLWHHEHSRTEFCSFLFDATLQNMPNITACIDCNGNRKIWMPFFFFFLRAGETLFSNGDPDFFSVKHAVKCDANFLL